MLWANATSSVEAILGSTSVGVSHSFGLAGQVGVDMDINERWFINADIKYIDMDTIASLNSSGGTSLLVDLDVNPWIFGFGLGYHF
jgi:outer membrane protein